MEFEVQFSLEIWEASIIGTSSRRCSRSPLGGRLAMTLVAPIFLIIFDFFFWHEQSALQSTPLGVRQARTLVATISIIFFLLRSAFLRRALFSRPFWGPPALVGWYFFHFLRHDNFS